MNLHSTAPLVLCSVLLGGCASSPKVPLSLVSEPVTEPGTGLGWSPGKVQVREVSGQAWYVTAGDPQPLKVGMVLTNGAALQTDPDAQVDLYLGINGPVLRLLANSELGFGALDYTKDLGVDAVVETKLTLRRGRLLGSVRKLASQSSYEVSTPGFRFAIRGTDYMAFASGDLMIFKGLATVDAIRGEAAAVTVQTGGFFEAATSRVRLITKAEYDEFLPIVCFVCPVTSPGLVYGEWPGRHFN